MTVSQICSLFLQSMVLILSLLLWGQGISKWRDGVAWLPRYASRFELCETRWVLMWFGLSLLVIPEMLRSAWEVSSEDLRSSIQVDACTRLLLVPVVGMLILRRRAAVTSREEHAEEPSRGPISWGQAWRVGMWGFGISFLPVSMGLQLIAPFRQDHRLIQLLKVHGDLTTWLWVILAAAIAAPLYEELMFRVMLQGTLEKSWSPAVSNGLSSALFAALHGWDFAPIFALSLVLGYLHSRTRSYFAVVWMHALFNGFNLLALALRP